MEKLFFNTLVSSLFVQSIYAVPAPMPQYPPPMPLKRFLAIRSDNTEVMENPTPAIFREQMINPSEVFSVLLIIGADIVQKAIAQMAGGYVTLVCFSFGWVAYAFSALMAAFGDGQFMPPPDYPAVVITASSGIQKVNYSWVLGRLIRDMEVKVGKSLRHFKEQNKAVNGHEWISEDDSGMLVTVFEACPNPGIQHMDKSIVSYFVFLFVQLVIASIPVITKRNWSILFLTVMGSLLSIVTGSLREWRQQKYSCRKGTSATYIMTRGNGHRHVFVVCPGSGEGLYLEDLAGAVRTAGLRTRISSGVLAFFWLAFLITSGGLKSDTWFLLGVGAAGMCQNILVAGLPRSSRAIGIPLQQVLPTIGRRQRGIGRPKVMDVLFEVEALYPSVGLAIRREYFPDHALRENEVRRWEALEATKRKLKDCQRRENEQADKIRRGVDNLVSAYMT